MSRILIVDDEADIRELAALCLQGAGHETIVASSAEQAVAAVEATDDLDVVLTDLRIGKDSGLEVARHVLEHRPDVPVLVMTGFSTVDAAIDALRVGVYDFLTKPLESETLRNAVRRAAEHRELDREVKRLRKEVDGPSLEFDMVGQSSAMRRVFDLIDRVADSEATVLVTGQSGTGKELVARALHRRSGRKGRFVAVNCAAVPASLIESELFGHVRGAFTDANRKRKGLFSEADGGTLFLDEIGELDLQTQPKLLRALQERKIRPVGDDREVEVDVRIVAATNRDLEDEVAAKRFRQDLFYRINVVNIHLPPLRARGHDVLRLAQSFLERFAARSGKPVRGISKEAAEKLLAYDWPGNVRELENCMERAVALARYDEVAVGDLPDRIRSYEPERLMIDVHDPAELPTLDALERRYVQKVLTATGGNKTRAAKVLGVDRRTLYRKLHRWEAQDKKRRERKEAN